MNAWRVSRLIMLFAAGFASLSDARAGQRETGAVICENAIISGAQQSTVPRNVLHAIALTETGRKLGGRLRPYPWAINREGKSHWFATRAEALAFARQSVADGRHSFDVGCFQINYRWHGNRFSSLEQMFEPDAGARYAARFLTDLYGEFGDWSLAAGAYHSRTPGYARRYRARFDRMMSGAMSSQLAMTDLPKQSIHPRKSRTRLRRKPLIIRIEKTPTESIIDESAGQTMAILRGDREPPQYLTRISVDAESTGVGRSRAEF